MAIIIEYIELQKPNNLYGLISPTLTASDHELNFELAA